MLALLGILLGFLVVGGAVSVLLVRGILSYLDRQLAIASRKLDLEERAVAVQEQRSKGVRPPAAIPPDLMRRVLRWQDVDAQAGERKILLDLYAEFASETKPEAETWTNVRQHLPRELPDLDEPGTRELFVA